MVWPVMYLLSHHKQVFWTKLALTGVSASVAEACTYPIDAIKTRLQLQVKAGGSIGIRREAAVLCMVNPCVRG